MDKITGLTLGNSDAISDSLPMQRLLIWVAFDIYLFLRRAMYSFIMEKEIVKRIRAI